MSKGEETRKRVVIQAAAYLNRHGYYGASISEVLEVTGLQKGGLYNHFSSKEGLAVEAFHHNLGILREKMICVQDGASSALEKINRLVDLIPEVAFGKVVPGGCPVLKAATESNNNYPVLKEEARIGMEKLIGLFSGLVKEGIVSGELRPELDPRRQAAWIVALLEGCVVLGQLLDDEEMVHGVISCMKERIQSWKKGE